MHRKSALNAGLYVDFAVRYPDAGFLQDENAVNAGIVAKFNINVKYYVNTMQDLMQKPIFQRRC